VAISSFDKTFTSYLLERTIDSEGHLDLETDLWVEGTPIPERFRVWFKPTSSPVIRAQVGADTQQTAVRGRLLEPLEPPATAESGAEYEIQVAGRTQKLTVIWQLPSVISDIDEELGRSFVGVLK